MMQAKPVDQKKKRNQEITMFRNQAEGLVYEVLYHIGKAEKARLELRKVERVLREKHGIELLLLPNKVTYLAGKPDKTKSKRSMF